MGAVFTCGEKCATNLKKYTDLQHDSFPSKYEKFGLENHLTQPQSTPLVIKEIMERIHTRSEANKSRE